MDARSPKVQRVTKASSDELLRKFAELDDADTLGNSSSPIKLQLVGGAVRRKKSSRRGQTSVTSAASASAREFRRCVESSSARRKVLTAEKKSLLPTSRRRTSSVPRRSIGAGRELYALGFVLEALEKTWRKTIEGASRILVERHCNSHVQLLNDVV